MDEKEKIRRCPECGSNNLLRDYEAAEIVCLSCGCVVVDKLTDSRPEWRAFDNEQKDKRTRVGAPLTYTIHDKGLSTTIDLQGKNLKGDSIQELEEAYKLRKWQRRMRVSDATERNLAAALSELTKIASVLNLPKNVLETASIIYRKAIKKRIVRGRSIQSIAAAAIYLSCRKCGVLRTIDEIADTTNLRKKDIGRSYRFMIKELSDFVPPLTISNYAARFSNKLAISGKAEAIAIKILEMAKAMRLTSGRGPTGIAAASTYIASVLLNERKTQREVAEIANVTEVTIRNRYKELLEKLLIKVKL
jgi:transcription initiation factor TFIIB